MTTTNVVRGTVIGALALTLLAGVGCQQRVRMGKYDLLVTPDASLRDSGSGRLPQTEVDLIGLKEDEVADWSAYSIDSYFSGDDVRRSSMSGATKSLVFSPGSESPIMIPASDPIWNTWASRGATNLMILASGRTIKGGGGLDPRRKSIPITTDKWDVRKIDIVVKSSGVEVPTPMKIVK